MTTQVSRCPGCPHGAKGPGKYLCARCWPSLPLTTQRALNRRDNHARVRLQQLHRQLAAGVPLADMVVSP